MKTRRVYKVLGIRLSPHLCSTPHLFLRVYPISFIHSFQAALLDCPDPLSSPSCPSRPHTQSHFDISGLFQMAILGANILSHASTRSRRPYFLPDGATREDTRRLLPLEVPPFFSTGSRHLRLALRDCSPHCFLAHVQDPDLVLHFVRAWLGVLPNPSL